MLMYSFLIQEVNHKATCMFEFIHLLDRLVLKGLKTEYCFWESISVNALKMCQIFC